MNQSKTLERLTVEVLGDDKNIQAALKRIESESKRTVAAVEKEWSSIFGGVGADMGASFSKAWDVIATEAERGGKRVASSTTTITKEIALINREVNLATQQFRAGMQGTAEYGKALDAATYALNELRAAGNLNRAETVALEQAVLRAEKGYQQLAAAEDDTGLSTEHLKNLVHELRHATESNVLTQEEAVRAFQEVKDQALAEAAALEAGTKAKRELMGVAATSSRSIKTLSGELTALGFSGNTAVGITNSLNRELKDTETQVASLTQVMGPINRGGGLLGLLLGGAAGAGGAATLRTGVLGAMGIEDFLVTLQAISSEGARIFDDIYHASDRLPATWEQLMRGTQALTGFGVAGKDILPITESISTVAAVLGTDMDRLVQVFGRVSAQGRLSMTEVDSLISAQVPIVEALANQYGIAESEVRALVNSGVIGFNEFAAAFRSITEEGGRFGGLLDELERTTSGRLRKLADSFSIVTDTIGENTIPGFERLINVGQQAVDTFNNLDPALQNTLVRLGITGAGMVTFGGIVVGVAANLARLRTAVVAVNAVLLANPWVLVATAAAGLATWLLTTRQETGELRHEFGDLDGALSNFRTGVNEAEDALWKLNEAQDEQALRGSVRALAEQLDGEGREAFIAYAEQAILTAEDVVKAGAMVRNAFADMQAARLEAELDTRQAILDSVTALHADAAEVFDMYNDQISAAVDRRAEIEQELRRLDGSADYYDHAGPLLAELEVLQNLIETLDSADGRGVALQRLAGFREDLTAAQAHVAEIEQQLEDVNRLRFDPDGYFADLAGRRSPAVVNFNNDLRTGASDAVTSGIEDALKDSRAWVARILGEWEIGSKDADTARALLVQAAETNRAELHKLYRAGTFTGEEVDILLAKLNLVDQALAGITDRVLPDFQLFSFPRPDEGEGLTATERKAYEAAVAARELAEAQAELLAQYEQGTPTVEAFNAAFTGREEAAAQAAGYRSVVLALAEVDEATMRTLRNSETLRDIVASLNTEFKQPAPDEGQGGEFGDVYARLAADLEFAEAQAAAFGDTVDLNSLKARAYETAINSLLQGGVNPLSAGVQSLLAHYEALGFEADAALQATARTAELEQATSAYQGLMAALEGIGRTVDPIEAQRQALRDLAATGVLTAGQVVAAIQAEGAARKRLQDQVDAADYAAMQEAALAAFNDVQARMDEFFGRTESEFDQMRAAAQAAFDAGTISAEDFAEALADIDAAEATTRLVDTLGQVETALHSIGGAVGGSIGDLAKNLGDAVGVAKQFASGDITGGIISTVTMIAGGIADMVNANGEWARSVDQLSDRYRNLSRETVEALTKSRTETRWFLFIPYKVRVVDESATSEAMRVAQDFLSALDGALKSADFGADFNLGIDRLIQAEVINGFMRSRAVQQAVQDFVDAIGSGNRGAADRAYRELEEATRRQNELLREQFPELYKVTDKAKDYADEMERAKRATQDMLAVMAGNQLERAFATGAVGLERYARELQRLTQQGITSDYARQEAELRQLIAEAREAQADPAYIRALEEQLRTLGDAFRDALEQGAFEANQAIRDLLGTSVTAIQDIMRGAFDTATVDDFLTNWGAGITDVTRRGLITAFLESSRMKSALDNIGQMIADAVLDGVVTQSELQAIQDAYQAVGEDAAQFWEVLDRLGLGFDGLADTVDTLNDSMRNVPSIFKATQAQWDAMQPSIPSSAAFMASSSSAPAGATHVTEVHFHGDVYGLDDFDDKVNAAVDGRANRLNTSAYGRS